MPPAADAAPPTEYTLECYRCGKRGTNVIFGFGHNRRCPDCGSYQVHSTREGR